MDFVGIDFSWQDVITILSFIASIVALLVALITYRLQKKSDKNLNRIENDINKIDNNINQMERNISLIGKIFFQIEKTSARTKYPNNENFKKINESYQRMISSLFDETNFEIVITSNKNKKEKNLPYKVEPARYNRTNIPITKMVMFDKFYIIKVISLSYLAGIKNKQIEDDKYNPIKEGEYYGCRFIESSCKWIMGSRLSSAIGNQEFFEFDLAGSDPPVEEICSANEYMNKKLTQGKA